MGLAAQVPFMYERPETVTRFGASGRGGDRHVVVFESVAPPGKTIKFVDQVVRHAPGDLRFRYFSWPVALFGRFDVFHVHWPEYLVRAPGLRGNLKRLLFQLFLLRLRLTRRRVVRTLHNLEPHTPGDANETRLLSELASLVDVNILLNECGPTISGRTRTILHGDYRDAFAPLERESPVRGRILFLGRIEPYKGVEALVEASMELQHSDLELRIVGKPSSDMRDSLATLSDDAARDGAPLTTRLEFVSDADMVKEITAAEVVILPYHEMYNSGIALVALSLDRPVILPSSCTTDRLSAEVGAGWAVAYDGPISARKIQIALAEIRSRSSSAPNLSRRDWRMVAGEYASVFRETARASSSRHEQTGA